MLLKYLTNVIIEQNQGQKLVTLLRVQMMEMLSPQYGYVNHLLKSFNLIDLINLTS